jgi:hypothetical protein
MEGYGMDARLGWCALVLWAAVVPSVAAGDRAIYRCEIDGQLTFSDRPCAPAAQPYELDPKSANTYQAPAVRQASSLPSSDAPAAKAKRDAVAESKKHKETCERLALRLKEIRSKQRAGYTAEQGERLQATQERLKSQFRLARCG